MDHTETADRRTVALPGLCARVGLPKPPNFLQTPHGGSVPIGELHPQDAALLGMAMLRQVVDHWRQRFTKREGLSPTEAQDFPADSLVHDAVVRTVSRDTSTSPDTVRAVLTAYLLEVTRNV